jgi:DNA repair protein RecO (recombination protein O)
LDSRTTGLILRTRPLTETSLIVHWLTPDFGRIATVAKGARRPKSPFRGKLDLFYLCELTFARSRRSDLHTLREVSLRETHSSLRRELGWLEQASYAAAFIEQTTEAETPLDGFYELFSGFLATLVTRSRQSQTVLAFELKLLNQCGQSPDLNSTPLSEGSQRIAERLTQGTWEELSRLRPSAGQVRELSRFLLGFLFDHLGRVPRGREAALASDA